MRPRQCTGREMGGGRRGPFYRGLRLHILRTGCKEEKKENEPMHKEEIKFEDIMTKRNKYLRTSAQRGIRIGKQLHKGEWLKNEQGRMGNAEKGSIVRK